MSPARITGLVVATLLTLPATGCAGSSTTDAPAPSADDARTGSTSTGRPGASPATPARRAESVVRPAVPRLAVLPSGREVPVSAVGTTAAGLLAVPSDIREAGWWRGGSRLGDPYGSILLAAHVDSRTQGLGPFAELLSVTPGSQVVLRSGGLRQAFEVRSRQLVPQGDLADDGWIFAATGRLRLTLVTCAPPYVASRGGYQNLAVVTAVPVGRPERS